MSNDTELLSRMLCVLDISLSPKQSDDFQKYYSELFVWNKKFNLTRILDYSDVQALHFFDSLTIVRALNSELLKNGQFLDIGSGAGFPGIPLKIMYPGIKLTLIEATKKKAAFLNHIVQTLGLELVNVYSERSEILAHDPSLRSNFDVVLARGVAPLRTLVELTVPFCKVGGLVVVHKGRDAKGEILDASNAIQRLGSKILECIPTNIEQGTPSKCLVVIGKDEPTDGAYPRRVGIPRKRPL